MAVTSSDIVLFASGAGPKIVARCTHSLESGTFAMDALLLGEGAATARIDLVQPRVAISEKLLLADRSGLKPIADIVKEGLQSAYAALCIRLTDLEIDRTTGFLGLPATARYSVKASIVLPPITSKPGELSAGFRAQCHVEVATKEIPAKNVGIKGRFDFAIEYTAKAPVLLGTFGWPSFGLSFVEPDFSDFMLIARSFALPDPGGWLPKTRIVWAAPAPTLRLTLDQGLSLAIDVDGAAATGSVELDGTEILKIDAFKVAGPIDDLSVTTNLSPSLKADVPPGKVEAGPLTIAWKDTTVEATGNNPLVITTHVGELTAHATGGTDKIVVSLDIVTRYAADGTVDTRLDKVVLIDPAGAQLPATALRELGNLKRIVVPLSLPQAPDALFDRIGAMGRAILSWLGAGLDSVGGALIGLGKAASGFASQIFEALKEVDASGAKLVVELRWDSVNGVLKQIVFSRAGGTLPARTFDVGELKVTFPGVSQPMLVLDLVDRWLAVAAAPTAPFETEFSTDLWLAGATGTTAVRGSEPDPLIKLKATVKPRSGYLEPIALVLLGDGRARFFQSLGGGPADQVAGVLSIGSPLVPGAFDPDVEVDITINKERLTSIFPSGSGSASSNSSAPKVKVKSWSSPPGQGSVREIEVVLEVIIGGAKTDPIEATVTGTFDVRSLELRFGALEIPIPAPDPINFFGAKATFVPNSERHAFVLRVDEAASVALATGARAELRFDGIGEGEDVLTFDAEGPRGLALGISGLDLDAKVRQNPIRLPGLDTPFRFTGGAIRVERGRFLAAGITGSGALPPALLGEAKIDAGIQFKRDEPSGSLVVESATARLERAGEPLVCESTRFHFALTHVGLGFKTIEGKIQFYGELTGSATFRPNAGEFAGGLLARLPEIKIDFERAPIAGDGRALSKAIKFQIPINPPARAKLFDIFEFELRGIGFHPAYDGWADTPPTLSLSGQARMTESFDIVQTSIEAHQLYVTRSAPGGTLPRVRMDGLGIGLRIAAMGEFSGTAIAVDGSLPSLFKPEALPTNIAAKGFLASGRLMLKGWAAMSGAAGFLELSPKDASAKIGKRLSFYIYVQQEQLSEAIPTPVGTLYLREVGFGFGFRYTLAALAQTDRLTDPRDIITTLDPLSKSQGDLSSFASWQPEIEGDRLTLAMRALFSVTTASSATVYNAEKEKNLDNPVLFDVVAALRSDLTFLLSARAWIAVNYADWLNGSKDWREKPILRGYIYISAPKRIFLGRLIVDPKGHVGEHPKLPKPLVDALGYVKSATATLYITPDIFHQELGWPYELELALGDPKGTFHASLSGGMVLRIEDGAVLHGIAFKASGHVRIGGRAGGSVGASAQALATFALDGKFIAYVSVARPADSLFYGRLALALGLEFTIEFWVETKFFSLSASWSEKIDVEIDLELAVGPTAIGGHARASLSLRRFGRGLRLGVSLGFHESMLGAARGRVERFMALGLGATVPDPATGLPPLPETARKARAQQGDDELKKLAERRESLPLPNSDEPADPGPPSLGEPITSCDFWAIVMPIRGKSGQALLHLVPKDPETPDTDAERKQAFFGAHDHGDFFVSPAAPGGDTHRRSGGFYAIADTSPTTPVVDELQVPPGHVRGVPLWNEIIDPKSGSTVADLVASGFLKEDGGRLTQPGTEPVTPKEKRDTVGCLEARGALIGHVAEQARLLADNWTDAPGNGARADFDPRWFGLTFLVGDGQRPLKAVLDKLFEPSGDGVLPRAARFTVAKSDVIGPPQPGMVELFNPIERWFENAQPRLAQPRVYMQDRAVRLAWDLEPRWGASQSRYDDPEYHLMHYAIQRHVEVTSDRSRRYHASWLAKGAQTIDLFDGPVTRAHQVADRLENLPESLRNALLLLLSKQADQADVLQQKAHGEAVKAWREAFGALKIDGSRASVKLVYSIVPIDNSGTRGDPSPPIELEILAPLPERAAPFGQVGLAFEYQVRTSDSKAFPRSAADRPSRLSVTISTQDLPEEARPSATGQVPAVDTAPWPAIELFFDITRDARSGIFGADLLEADRHRHRVVSPTEKRSALLQPGKVPSGAIPVDVVAIDPDQKDPTVLPEVRSYYLTAGEFDDLVGIRLAAQVHARWLPAVASTLQPAPWTRCDLKLRISRKRDDLVPNTRRYDDFIAPIAEFEQLVLTPKRLLPEGSVHAEQGILYRMSPKADAVLADRRPKVVRARDPKDRRAIRLAWKARPLSYCDGTTAEPDRIGGFDLFVASRDRETDTVLGAGDRARLAQPLGRILVKPKALLGSEPAQIEDFSKLDVAYPSAASISRGRGWYSAAESRLIWPKPVQRRSLMLVPDEGMIGEMFSQGKPEKLHVRLQSIETDPFPLLLDLAAIEDLNHKPRKASVELEPEVDGWRPVKFLGEVRPSAVRDLLQRLIWGLGDEQVPLRAKLMIKYERGEHEIEVALGGEVHPILADLLDLLRYDPADFAGATGYRRYEPVLEGAPAPGADTPDVANEGAQKPPFAQLLSDTSGSSDKAGWSALRQLGLAVGFRLWDTETSDWVDPGENRAIFDWAWRHAIARCRFAPGEIGAPFLEQFYDPEELYVLRSEDLLRNPRTRDMKGMPLLQASLRPIADRLLSGGSDGEHRYAVHYLKLAVEGARVRAAELDEMFADIAPEGTGRAYVQMLLPSSADRPGSSSWVGSPIGDADAFKPDAEYLFPAGTHEVLARIVLAGNPMHSENVASRLRSAIVEASEPGAVVKVVRLDWSPADGNEVPVPQVNPYLRFEPVPAELSALTESPWIAPADGRERLKDLARRRYTVTEGRGADEALALQRWEKRFFELGSGMRIGAVPSVGIAFATMDAPASLRRAPDEKGRISILYLDEGQLGSWRRFYVRPFGRYDHLAQASGWLDAIEGRLDGDDFGGPAHLKRRPWVDVTLARSREIPKPVLLASTYAETANALVLVAARSDQDVLAGANVPQAGAAQMGGIDVGFSSKLDEPRLAWANALLPTWNVLPDLTAKALPPPDTVALEQWLMARATPPRLPTATSPARPVPDRPLPDLWRGATAVAAYDLPYFFDYSAQLAASAGVAISQVSEAELPSPRPVDFNPTAKAEWELDGDDVIIRLPLTRFADCMDPDSFKTWYRAGEPSAPLFELPDPAIVYRIYLRSPLGDMWSSEIDIEAEPAEGTYSAHVTGQTFGEAACDPPIKSGDRWSLALRAAAPGFDEAAGSALVVVPVRQTEAMTAIKIEKAP